ncbi:methyltransferase domain-containing protein [Nocardia sp. NPDC057030]|uniref:methyltransferase domain-containing protein n=1 Tax=unclassified Nocardia TaxID=2637762 RepID=UPI00363015B5
MTTALWDRWHTGRDIATRPTTQRLFVSDVLACLDPVAGKHVLELACGQGGDAVHFARHGARVTASDLSAVAVAKARVRAASAGVDVAFHVRDMRDGPPVDQPVDAVISYLGLHYFPPAETAALFAAIDAILLPGGLLAFAVKSTSDPLFGDGEKVDDHVFVRKGKLRHFFSVGHVETLLPGWALNVTEHTDNYQTLARPAVHLHVLATKP